MFQKKNLFRLCSRVLGCLLVGACLVVLMPQTAWGAYPAQVSNLIYGYGSGDTGWADGGHNVTTYYNSNGDGEYQFYFSAHDGNTFEIGGFAQSNNYWKLGFNPCALGGTSSRIGYAWRSGVDSSYPYPEGVCIMNTHLTTTPRVELYEGSNATYQGLDRVGLDWRISDNIASLGGDWYYTGTGTSHDGNAKTRVYRARIVSSNSSTLKIVSGYEDVYFGRINDCNAGQIKIEISKDAGKRQVLAGELGMSGAITINSGILQIGFHTDWSRNSWHPMSTFNSAASNWNTDDADMANLRSAITINANGTLETECTLPVASIRGSGIYKPLYMQYNSDGSMKSNGSLTFMDFSNISWENFTGTIYVEGDNRLWGQNSTTDDASYRLPNNSYTVRIGEHSQFMMIAPHDSGAEKATIELTGNNYSEAGHPTALRLHNRNGSSYESMYSGSVTNLQTKVKLSGSAIRIDCDTVGVISGAISGSGGMEVYKGRLVLLGTNTFTGQTTINSGTILQLGYGATVNGNDASRKMGTLSNTSKIVNNGTFILSNKYDSNGNTATTTINVVISGSGSVELNDTGFVIFAKDNTYTGTTKVDGGNIRLGNGGSTGSFGTGNVTSNSSKTVEVNRTGSFNFTNLMGGSASSTLSCGEFKVVGTGTFTLNRSGMNVATFTSYNDSATSNLNVSQTFSTAVSNQRGTVNCNSTLSTNRLLTGNYSGYSTSITNINSGASVTVSSTDNTISNNAGMMVGHWNAADYDHYATLNVTAGTLSMTNSNIEVSWDGGGIMNVSGGTTNVKGILLTDHNANVKYRQFNLTGGTVNLGVNGLRYVTSAVTDDNASSAYGSAGLSWIKLGAGTLGTLAAWSSSANMQLTSTSGTTFNTDGYDVTLAGVLSGTGKLVKTGANQLLLRGNNTFSGGVDAQAGMVRVFCQRDTTESVTKLGTGTVTLSNNAMINTYGETADDTSRSYIHTIANNITIAASDEGSLRSGYGKYAKFSGVISAANATVNVGSDSGYVAFGNSSNSIGTLSIGASLVDWESGNAGARVFLEADNAFGGALVQFNMRAASTNGNYVAMNGHNATIAGLKANSTNAAYSKVQNLSDSAASTLTINTASDAYYEYCGTLVDGGSQVLNITKTGAGYQVFTGSSSYSGTTTVSAGTLELRNSRISGNVSVASGAQLYMNATVINNQNNITVTNNGRWIFDLADAEMHPAANSLGSGSHTVTINGGGELQVRVGMLAASSDGTGVTFAMGDSAVINIFEGATFRNGGGTNEFWTGNYGSMNVNGTLDVWDGAPIYINRLTGSGTITAGYNAGSTLYIGHRADGATSETTATFSGQILDGATSNYKVNLVKIGSGTQTLTGNSDFSGTTTVSDGTLVFTGSSTLNGAVSVDSGTLHFSGTSTINNDVSVVNGGLLLFTGNSVIDSERAVTVTNGTLQMGNNTTTGAIGSASVTLANAGTLKLQYLLSRTFTNAVTGTGTIVQNGTGTINLSSNLESFTGAVSVLKGTLNTTRAFTASNISITGGTLKNSLVTLTAGSTTVSGGTLNLDGGGLVSDVTVSGGTLKLNGSTLTGDVFLRSGSYSLKECTLNGDFIAYEGIALPILQSGVTINGTIYRGVDSVGSLSTSDAGGAFYFDEGTTLQLTMPSSSQAVEPEELSLVNFSEMTPASAEVLSVTSLKSLSTGDVVTTDEAVALTKLALNDGMTLDLTVDERPTATESGWADLIATTDGIVGDASAFDTLNLNFGANTVTYSGDLSSFLRVNGNSLQINSLRILDEYNTAVPEPSTWLLLALGVFGLTAYTRRRKTR